MAIILLVLYGIIGALVTWTGSRLSFLNIQVDRLYASSQYPGDLTAEDKIRLFIMPVGLLVVILAVLLMVFNYFIKDKTKVKWFRITASILALCFISVLALINYFYLYVDYPHYMDSGPVL